MSTKVNRVQLSTFVNVHAQYAGQKENRNFFLFCIKSVKEGSSRGSAVTVMALRPANLGSTVAGSHLSHWWRQKVHLAKISPMHQ